VKSENAALGFRVKSGWAAVVLLSGPIDSPQVCDSRRIDLCDARLPETRQPYHAGMGKLEMDTRKVSRRVRVVRYVARQSIAALLAGYQKKGYTIKRAALVVGSQIDPASIANPHIRAHAFEGQLFRSALEQALRAHRIRRAVLIERDIYAKAAAQLKESSDKLRHMIQKFGRFTEGPWRVEEKLAALGAWLALCSLGSNSKPKKRESLIQSHGNTLSN
jgi:hypothetical protein